MYIVVPHLFGLEGSQLDDLASKKIYAVYNTVSYGSSYGYENTIKPLNDTYIVANPISFSQIIQR